MPSDEKRPQDPYSDSEDSSIGLLSNVEAGLSEKYSLDPMTRKERAVSVFHKIWQVLLISSRRCGTFLLPSFISSWLLTSDADKPKARAVRPIAYLDGLRGFAAWSVFNAHLCPNIARTAGASWSHDGYWQWWRLPLFKLAYSGVFAVGLFFVIGGLTCSLGAVTAMNTIPRKPGSYFEKSAASVFRRPLRLLLPSFAAMFVVFCLIRIGYFEPMRNVSFAPVIDNWNPAKDWPARFPSIFTQLYDCFWNMTDLLDVWTGVRDQSFKLKYYPPLWTIKCELRASLMLFTMHQAIFYLTRRARIVIASFLLIVGLAVSSTEMPAFIAGYMIAEWRAWTPLDRVNKGFLWKAMWWFMLSAGIFVGAYPSWDDVNTPSHAWLRALTPFRFEPHDRFWGYLGSALVVIAMSRMPKVMAFFSSPLAMYLSRISYALYLVHFWMVQTLGPTVFYYAWLWTGQDTVWQTYLGFILAYPVVLFFTVWVADIFARAVEDPLGNLTAKFQKRVFKQS